MFCTPHLQPSQQLLGCGLWKWGSGRLSSWSQHTARKWLALDPVFSDSTVLSGLLHPGYPQSCAELAFLSLVGNTNNHSLPTLGLVSWSLYLFILILTVLGSSLWHVGLVAWPGIEHESPASESRVLTTGPPGRSLLESWELFRWTFSQKQPPFQRR